MRRANCPAKIIIVRAELLKMTDEVRALVDATPSASALIRS